MSNAQSNIRQGTATAMFCTVWSLVASFQYGFGYESILFISSYALLSLALKKPNKYLGFIAIILSIVFSISHLAMFHPLPVALFFVTLMYFFVRYTQSAIKLSNNGANHA